MIYNYYEIIEKCGNDYNLNKALKSKEIIKIENGLYSDEPNYKNIDVFIKKYKNPIFTMESAFYYYGITKNLGIMKKNERFVITINRELGSGGRTVGRVLAEKLGVPYYDKVLSKALEEKFDLSHRQIEELKGKNRSWWEEIKRVLVLGEGAANSSEYYDEDNNRYVTSEAVLKAEREILQNIASEESCVIAGRSAFFAMNENPNHLSVLIQASMDHRLKRVMAKQGLTEKEAKKVIKMVDETREEYMKNNAHTSRYDTRNYDLVIRMDGKTEEEAANVILAYIG